MLHTKNIKALRLPVSKKKNFEVFLSSSLRLHLRSPAPGAEPVLTPGHHMKKVGSGPLADATYHMSELPCLPALERKFKFSFIVPMSKFVIPGAEPVLTLGASYDKLSRGLLADTTYRMSRPYAFQFQRRTLNFSFFAPMFKIVNPGTEPVLTPGASYEQT